MRSYCSTWMASLSQWLVSHGWHHLGVFQDGPWFAPIESNSKGCPPLFNIAIQILQKSTDLEQWIYMSGHRTTSHRLLVTELLVIDYLSPTTSHRTTSHRTTSHRLLVLLSISLLLVDWFTKNNCLFSHRYLRNKPLNHDPVKTLQPICCIRKPEKKCFICAQFA